MSASIELEPIGPTIGAEIHGLHLTRKKALFVNPHFTLRINELTDQESDALLKLLFEQTHVPEYQFRLRWKHYTIVLWDNASTQHCAANDYYPNRRRMERVAVIGDKPY